MKTIEGKHTSAVVYSDTAEEYALAQIRQLCDQEVFEGAKVRVMPDVHPGKVGPIGFTALVKERIMPAVVGIDIGCGMTITKVDVKRVDGQKMDRVIRENVPTGLTVRKTVHRYMERFDFAQIRCAEHIRLEQSALSLGTLGGGNHFIEVDRGNDGSLYLIVHSGSRRLGKDVAEYYMKKGHELLGKGTAYELTYLEGNLIKDYIEDVQMVQAYAELNRLAIADEILKGLKWKAVDQYSCIHNYIEVLEDGYMIRKGAIRAEKGDKLIIPVNMRDGVILATGRGNAEWNCSAPHGAGRVMKREDVAKHHTLSEYKKMMKGIYSSTVSKETLDEAPFAYRGIGEIENALADTAEINEVIKPVYNFKAGSGKD